MQHVNTWIIVSNSTEARIYQLLKFPKIEEIETFVHPESHLLNQELVSSKQGRTFQSTNTSRSAYEPKTSPKQLEVDKFAKSLGEHLATSLQKGMFDRLYIFAEPSFLGCLRQYLSKNTKDAIIKEDPKDLTKHKISEIEKHLEDLL